MIHNSHITINGSRFSSVLSVIAGETKHIIHTTVGVIKSLVNKKLQKKFQRKVKKDKTFKSYKENILKKMRNISVQGALINSNSFILVNGQHRVYEILKDEQEIELEIYDVENWPQAADLFFCLNNMRPQSAAIILHNSFETGPFLRKIATVMKELGYIDGFNLEGREIDDENNFTIDCQDIALLLKASITGKETSGALHKWIRDHKHEFTDLYLQNFIIWIKNMTNKLLAKTTDKGVYDRNVQVALACSYSNIEKRELAEENIRTYVNDKNYFHFRKNMSGRGSDRGKAWSKFISDAEEAVKNIKEKVEELRVVAVV